MAYELINYEQDDRLIDFVRPIFEETANLLVGDRLKEMRFEDDEDKFIFTGVVSCENRDRNHSRVPTHLHILANMRDGVINKPIVADRVLCHLMNADTDRPVENYVSTRHKLLQDKDLRRYYWCHSQREKEKMFPDRNGDEPILNYSIFKSRMSMESWRTELDLRDVRPLQGFGSDVQVQIKPPLIKGHLIRRFLSPYGLKNNETNILPFPTRNISDDLNRNIQFEI